MLSQTQDRWQAEAGNSIIVPITINAQGHIGVYNSVNTVFDEWDADYVADLLRNGNILYTKNGRSIDDLLSQRRQVPKVVDINASSTDSITEEAEKSNSNFSGDEAGTRRLSVASNTDSIMREASCH